MISIDDVLHVFGEDICIVNTVSLVSEQQKENGTMAFNKDAPKPTYVKVGSLWRNKTGAAALTGTLGGSGGPRISIFPVKDEYKKENGPDYEICISPAAPRKQEDAPKKAPKDDLDEIPF